MLIIPLIETASKLYVKSFQPLGRGGRARRE